MFAKIEALAIFVIVVTIQAAIIIALPTIVGVALTAIAILMAILNLLRGGNTDGGAALDFVTALIFGLFSLLTSVAIIATMFQALALLSIITAIVLMCRGKFMPNFNNAEAAA